MPKSVDYESIRASNVRKNKEILKSLGVEQLAKDTDSEYDVDQDIAVFITTVERRLAWLTKAVYLLTQKSGLSI